MELKPAKKKRFKTSTLHCPLPIFSDGKYIANEYDWPIICGQYIGNSVVIYDQTDIMILATKGCFGKGSLSRGCPTLPKRPLQNKVISESQWKRRKHWIETSLNENFPLVTSTDEATKENVDEIKENTTTDIVENSTTKEVETLENTESKDECSLSKPEVKKEDTVQHSDPANRLTLMDDEVLVIADLEENSDESLAHLNPHIEKETVKTVSEYLYLSLEEAFFLSYALNCLQVIDLTSKNLSFKQMWNLYRQSQPNFIENYVAYHYFRAKGWVVKCGVKYGSDFLLYKKGPLYFHASYIVLVQLLNHNGEKVRENDDLTWVKMFGVTRTAESATKDVLICRVMRPDLPEDAFQNPSVLKEYCVDESLVRRWQLPKEKE